MVQYVCSWYIMIGENPWMHTIRHLVMCDRKGEVKNTTLFPFLHSLFNSSTSLFPSLPPSLFLPLLLTSLYRMGRSSGMGWSTTLVVCSAMVSPTHEQCSSHDNHNAPHRYPQRPRAVCPSHRLHHQAGQHTKHHISLIAEKQTDRGI